MSNCILCDSVLSSYREINDTSFYDCKCPNCGNFEISNEAQQDLLVEFMGKLSGVRHLISGYVFEQNTDINTKLKISNSNIKDIIDLVIAKDTIEHKIDRLLHYIYTKTNFYGKEVIINKELTAICYAMNDKEVYNLCNALNELGFISLELYELNHVKCTLKTSGYAHINEKMKLNSRNKQCFVAMWFNKEIIEGYSQFITKAITDTGFQPFISVNMEHNDNVCDVIVAGIKNSRFMIADFTGQRPSVYFEAGLASGLGIPVIWICREDWFNNQVNIQKEAVVDGKKQYVEVIDERYVHFDVNHYKFIVWTDGEDLYKKLINRIEATIKLR